MFLKSEFETVSTTRLVFEGAPGQVILDYAAKEKPDLIMTPTHGYGPFRRFLLGSVTAKILHDAHCPVFTSVHMRETAGSFAGYSTVLCAVDFSSSSLPLLRWAYEFARERQATLKVVHAIPAGKPLAGFDIDGAMFRSSLFEMAKVELAKLQSEAGTNLEAVLEGDEVAAGVTKGRRRKSCQSRYHRPRGDAGSLRSYADECLLHHSGVSLSRDQRLSGWIKQHHGRGALSDRIQLSL